MAHGKGTEMARKLRRACGEVFKTKAVQGSWSAVKGAHGFVQRKFFEGEAPTLNRLKANKYRKYYGAPKRDGKGMTHLAPYLAGTVLAGMAVFFIVLPISFNKNYSDSKKRYEAFYREHADQLDRQFDRGQFARERRAGASEPRENGEVSPRTVHELVDLEARRQCRDFIFDAGLFMWDTGRGRLKPQTLTLRLASFVASHRDAIYHLDLGAAPTQMLQDERVQQAISKMRNLQDVVFPNHGWSSSERRSNFLACLPPGASAWGRNKVPGRG
ncbi:unnamed protein product [Effrenium voratum]|nr:unnamed protein product [Effrenium voratum]